MLGRCAIAVVLAVALPATIGRPAGAPRRDGVILVGFRSRLPASRRRRIADRLRATRLRRVGARAHLLHVGTGRVDDAITALRDDPDVRFAEPDYVQTVSGIPNDPSFSMQCPFQNTGQSVGELHLYYAVATGSAPVTVRAAFSAANGHPWIALYELAGANPAHPLDRTAHAAGSNAAPNTGPTGTTAVAGELVVAALGLPSSTAVTVAAGPGYVLGPQSPSAGGSRAAAETGTAGTPGAYAGTFVLSGSANWSAVAATFAPAP